MLGMRGVVYLYHCLVWVMGFIGEKLLSFILIVSSVALLVSVLLLKFIFCDSEKEYFGLYAVPLGAFGLSGSLLVITDLSEAWKNKNSL